ncbi:hypothetical protein D3C74_417040 [compost metagenome]
MDVGEQRAELLGRAAVARELRELREVPDRDPEVDVDRPGRGLLAPQDELEERRLARAVAAHEPDALALAELEVGVAQHDLVVELHAHGVQADQAHRGPLGLRAARRHDPEHYAGGLSAPLRAAARQPFVARDLPLVAHLDRPST